MANTDLPLEGVPDNSVGNHPVQLAIDNLRLKELVRITEQNRVAFEDLLNHLLKKGYQSLHEFVSSQEDDRAEEALLEYLKEPFPAGVELLDGLSRPYAAGKGKWLLLGWVFRDAPEQRLRPMLSQIPGNDARQKQARLLNQVRRYAASIFTDSRRWHWESISEVMIDRLEGSRRAIRGALSETTIRTLLHSIFTSAGVKLTIADGEVSLEGETYDIAISGTKGTMLIPVKTRETMGGGHANLFSRDIHKSVSTALNAGYHCLPIIIAESWSADFSEIPCEDIVFANLNPNQTDLVNTTLHNELASRISLFQKIE